MKKLSLLLFMLTFVLGISYAQKKVSGTVSDDAGSTLIGANVVVKDHPAVGTITDLYGKYELTVPSGANVLIFSYTGYSTLEIALGDKNMYDVVLAQDFFQLDEIVVSGVASGTPRKKLTVSVDQVGSEQLADVPAVSAAAALQGKVAGVVVTKNTGTPGQSSSIILRGATSLTGNQEPLYIVDGAIMEGGLGDVNVDDIATIEVVKGAAAAALYGSRAGNGVVVIQTKRGDKLAKGSTQIVVRNEYGQNRISRFLPLSESHHYDLTDPNNPGDTYTKYAGVTYPGDYTGGTSQFVSGTLRISENKYQDNSFAFVNNLQDVMFRPGQFMTNYFSLGGNAEKTNFMVSFENFNETGIIENTQGYNRKNFRLNVDHRIGDKFKLSASNGVGKSYSNQPGGQYLETGGVFFDVLFLYPDVDLNRTNEEDGSDYDVDVSQWNTNEENPLYALSKVKREESNLNMMGSYIGEYYLNDWLTLDAKYTFDRRSRNNSTITPRGFLERSGTTGVMHPYNGDLYRYNSLLLAQTAQATANFNKRFGKLTTKAKLSYLYEDLNINSNSYTGYTFAVGGVNSASTISGDKFISDYSSTVRSENYFGILQLDYADKYLADVMYRYDGSSLFGAEQRWHPYYRISGGYRISEDLKISGVDEFKIRASYGTSGQRPEFADQYEVIPFSNGTKSSTTQIGNRFLKPSRSKEFEVGLNLELLKRFSFEFVYSNTVTEDQVLTATLPAYYGWTSQVQNAGTLASQTFEATLGIQLIKSKDFNWSANIVFDRIRQKVTELTIPDFQTGPIGQDADQAFFIAKGQYFGIIYGNKFVNSLEELAPQLKPEDSVDNYEVNSDGYVVKKGTQGTPLEKPIKLLDEKGVVKKVVIGNTNPDFRLGLSNRMSYKHFSLYFLVDWKQGGDVYNRSKQWLYRDLRHSDIDQAVKAENAKKTIDYYNVLYDINEISSHFVEDASYIKLREVSLYYTLEKLNFANGLVKELKIGVVGRNIYTFSGYSGYDPEVGQQNGAGSQFFAFDAFGYPNYRTFSGSLTLTF